MKKMHTISGNKQFMTKRAIPLLRKYGIQKSRANLVGGKTLELRFLIDDDKLERINKELKKMNRTAYDGIMEQLQKVIREEVQKLNEDSLQLMKTGKIDKLADIVIKNLKTMKALHLKDKNKEANAVLHNKVYTDLEYLSRAFKLWHKLESIKEGSVGKFGKDESDVFGGIVRMNKKKKPKDILKIVSKDKFLAKNIKRMRISNQELLDYIEDELEFFQFS